MRAFKNLPIKWKLMLAMMATSLTAILLLGSALFFAGLLHLRGLEIQETAALAEIVGGYCAGPLAKEDAAAAQRALANVAADQTIENAFLYTTDGRLLARYTRRDLAPEPPPKVAMPGESFAGDRLNLYRHVRQNGIVTGTIYLRANTWLMWARLKSYAGTGAVVMGLSMLVALIFANRLQRFFSTPITELARVAEAITTRRDFTQRAAKLSEDETGLLTEAFNKMLTIVQEHDSGSRASQSRLEKRIAERTVELRRVNEALREGHSLLQTIIESSNNPIYVYDLENRFLMVNTIVAKSIGLAVNEIVGKHVSQIFNPAESERLMARNRIVLDSGKSHVFEDTVILQGVPRTFLVNKTTLRDAQGKATGVVGVAHDITETKKAEKALRESEQRFRAVFEQATDGFLVADAETRRFSLPNRRICQMLGYSAEELVKMSVTDIHPIEDLPWVSENFSRQAAGEINLATEVPIRRKDGSVFYADINSRSLEIGGRRCLFGIFRDTTERKQVREALQHRLEIEQFVASASNHLANTAVPELDTVINETLTGLGRVTRTDRSFLFSVSNDFSTADNTHEWCEAGVQSNIHRLHNVPTAAFPWYLEQLRSGEPLRVPRVADLPVEAVAEKRLLQETQAQSVILVPIRHGGALVGFIGCDAVRAERQWSDEEVRLLRVVGELITDTQVRLRVNEALQEREERLQAVLKNSLDIAYRRDLRTNRYDFFSPAVEQVTGFPVQELLGKNLEFIRDRVHPDDLAVSASLLEKAQTGEVTNGIIEYRFKHKDGSYRWLSDRFQIVKDDDERPLYWVGVSRDVTVQKEMENALRESEHRYRTLTGSLPQLVWTCRPDGLCDYLGPQWINYTNIPETEQLGYGWAKQLHPDDWPRVQAAWAESVKVGAAFDIEFRIRRHDGVYRWFRTRALPLRNLDGQIVKWFGTNTDIDDLKQAEESLRRSEADLHIALDAAELGPWHWNIVTGELSWSPQCLTLYGLPANTAITYERFLETVHPDDREHVRLALREAVENRAEYVVEKRILLPGGLVRWTASRGRCSYDAAGQPLRMDGVSYDITQRKEAEQALLESEDRYRSLFASSMDAALLATADGRILAANPAACRMFGMPEAELVMVGRYGLVDLSDPRLKPAMEERNRTGRFYGELTFIRRDGTKFEGEIASVIIPTQTGEDRASVVIRDITERKRVEAALAKSRNLLLETEKIGNVGGWEFDIDTKQQVWTEEVHRIHEVDLTYKPTVEKGINFYTPESRSVIERAVQRAIEYGEPFDVKLEIITAKGNRRWVHAIGRADLKHRRVFGFFQDIHDRKRAEEALKTLNETLEQRVAERTAALQQRETELTEAQRVAHVGNWMWDIETGHVTWSDELYRIFDRDPKQFTPHIRDYPQILTAESCARRSTAAQRTIETGAPYELDLEIIRPDGERRWIVSHGEAVRDTSGRVVRLRGTAQDITDRKRAEESLRKSEERYHSLVDNLNVGVYRSTVESGGRLIQANPAMARMLSFESVNALMNVSVADIYQNPADRQTYLADLLCIGFVTGYELRLKKKDGTPIYCSVTAAAHRGPNGKVEWVDGILEDITERKRLEDQLIEISEREQRRIGQDLHDGLCQHLAGVGFMSKALAQKLAHNAPTEASDAQTVANLIRQAISEARGIATGLHPVKKEPNATMVALQELAANIESMFRVHCTFTCDPPILIEDNNVATHVYRIAQEAVNNALRHGKARNIWITLAGKNHRITLTVKDDGKGIPQPLPAGRGIGIDIMTHRARVIGGTFHIGRTPEGGTILTCSFPNLPAT